MAAKFRKVDPRIWTDEKFAQLGIEEKLLALWLLTSSRLNRCGITLWSPGLASEETGIKGHRIDTVLDTVCREFSWVYDTVSKTVFFPKWWAYNRPDNASALKGALRDLHDIPRNALKPHLIKAKEHIPTPLQSVYENYLDTVSDTVSPQEKEQKKEKEKEKKQDIEPPFPPNLASTFFAEAWGDWKTHRREIKKPLTPTSTEQQLAKLAEWGEPRAIAAIRHSIANGYQGIYEDKDRKNGKPEVRQQIIDNTTEWLNRGSNDQT